MSDLTSIPGIGPSIQAALESKGIHSKSDLAQAQVETIATIRGVSELRAEKFIASAKADAAPTPAAAAAAMPEPEPEVTPEVQPAFSRQSTNIVALVPTKDKAARKPKDEAALKAVKTAKKKAKAKLKEAKVKLDTAVKALKDARKEAAKSKSKGKGKKKSDKG